MRCKFILARKIRDKISAIRRQERKNAYQQRLFAPEAKVEVSFDDAFSFKAGMYQISGDTGGAGSRGSIF